MVQHVPWPVNNLRFLDIKSIYRGSFGVNLERQRGSKPMIMRKFRVIIDALHAEQGQNRENKTELNEIKRF